ncbi:hypothetical protein [Dyella tabacisoli]|uniref:DUF2946 domain-containing protein n=1 Tax=Dyella tabacisoli TaxID=2282381 RepID=A0A369UV24_9GAMM|nr:hypothetical protein [Dyella tabacisoli]RDD83588.1 hypothetical protein DVJ77_03160 [Dyella tabacisoli]
MSAHFLPSLRRCRALFALALCAWLMLIGMAWAQGGCCSTLHSSTAMTMDMNGHADMSNHDMHGDGHDMGHPMGSPQVSCTCACASATLPQIAMVAPQTVMAKVDDSPYFGGEAPQPIQLPPLRPPAA